MKNILNKIVKTSVCIIPYLLIVSCRSNQIITENIISESDSSAIVNYEDEISVREDLIISLQNDLTRFIEENINLRNEVSTYQINYDTSQPISPETLKPPISTEIITISNTRLEKTLNEYEILLQEASIENRNLTTKNSNLQLTVENLINENNTLKTQGYSSSRFNYKVVVSGLVILIIMSIYITLLKYK